jgi:glucan biosynthesis protein C
MSSMFTSTVVAPARQAPQEQREGKTGEAGRLLFIDNIRWVLMVLVVLVHVAVTYANIGDFWYYQEEREVDIVTGLTLAALCSFIQAFSMGLFFFLAGTFVPGSYDRKGAGKFASDRLVRLGVPTLFFMLLLHPLTEIIRDGFLGRLPADPLRAYAGYLASLEFLSESGPLWFALALLVFSMVYALIRRTFGQPHCAAGSASAAGGRNGHGAVTHGKVIALVLIIAALSFLVRIWFPFGTEILNMKPAYFPQYILLFTAGIWASRNRFFLNLPDKIGRRWLRIALLAGIPVWFLMMPAGGALDGRLDFFFGGLHWQAAAYASWDTLFCTGMVIGLIVLFRRRFNGQGRVTRFAADNTFGVYVFHAPLVVLITMLLKDWTAYPLLKFAVALLLAVPVCFLASGAIRRVPLMRRLFS